MCGLIPIAGLLLGPFAILFGWFGYRRAKTEPASDGLGHAVVSIVLGALEFVSNAAGLALLAHHYHWL